MFTLLAAIKSTVNTVTFNYNVKHVKHDSLLRNYL